MCIEEVKWVSIQDFAGAGFSGETCNEKSDHRFCNTTLLEGVENAAQTMCMPVSKTSDEGVCIAVCSMPSLDLDGDGVISEQEKGKTFNCPANYECKHELAKELGLIRPVKDIANPAVPRRCDPAQCESGKACPAQCGAGDAECLTVQTKKGTMSYCAASMGTCEPVATPAKR